MISVPLKRLSSTAKVPTYAHYSDAGADLYSDDITIDISPGSTAKVRTGIAVAIPYGYVGLVHPRSGLAAKHAVTVVNSPGTIDAGYRGEIVVLLINHGDETVTIDTGDRIAQLLIQKVEVADFNTNLGWTESDRGSDGFGSTGR